VEVLVPHIYQRRIQFSLELPAQQKRPRLRQEVAAGYQNFTRLLAAEFTRARFAGPLPREGEAVRKGEF
jgi:hypothetical protein